MSEVTAAPSVEVAQAFFDACETGKGWEVCQQFCTPDASFSAQAEPLDDIDTLEQYTDWMKGLLTLLSDAGYELKSFAADKDRGHVMGYGVFHGTHTGEGASLPPTGKRSGRLRDNLHVMEFEGDHIRHMTKIWNSALP